MLCSTPPACPCRRRASDRAVIQGRSKAPIRKRRPSMSDKLDNPVTGKPNIAAPPAHDHGKDANSRMLVFALILTSTFLVVEVIGSFVFNSLALLSDAGDRSEEHTSELQSLMRISYAVFCLKKKNTTVHINV